MKNICPQAQNCNPNSYTARGPINITPSKLDKLRTLFAALYFTVLNCVFVSLFPLLHFQGLLLPNWELMAALSLPMLFINFTIYRIKF